MKSYHIIACIVLLVIGGIILSGCSSEQQEEMSQTEKYQVTVKSSLRVRKAPQSSSPKIGDIFNGDIVEVYEVVDGWAKVSFGDSVGYISDKYIARIPENVAVDGNRADVEQISADVEEMASAETVHGTGSVTVIDKAKLLGQTTDALMGTRLQGDEKIIVVTTDSVDALKVADYCSNVLEIYENEIMKDNSNNLFLVTYINNVGLLQIRGTHRAINYIDYYDPNQMFRFQLMARESANLPVVINDVVAMIDEKCMEYDSLPWYKSLGYDVANIEDFVCDGLIVQNILPNHTLYYKYFFQMDFCSTEVSDF